MCGEGLGHTSRCLALGKEFPAVRMRYTLEHMGTQKAGRENRISGI
jgi:UDP:flavonoid glycosyltransferase YjiC (YdhE family)